LLEDWGCFFRSHKSWLINTKCVRSYSKSKSEITLSQNIIAKLSRYKKAEFEEVNAVYF
jgi:DNA-binding LytR/AlgR family response regulator